MMPQFSAERDTVRLMKRKIRYAFIDVDGVLSAPAYMNEETGEQVIGFSDEGWGRYLEEEGAYSYRYCKPVPQMKEYLSRLKEEGILVFVLSSVMNDTEKQAKILFLDRNYPQLFREYFFVKKDDAKVRFMKKFAELNQAYYSECLFIDDTYDLLLKAHNEGITCAHIANVLAGNISR